MCDRFTFAVPLIARASSTNWRRVEALFRLTLTSMLAQTDPDFTILVAGHDPPAGLDTDRRIRFLPADWPAQAPDAANNDGGRKKWLLKQSVLDGGGGLLMFVDADDWVDKGVVAAARAQISSAHIGGVISSGLVIDATTAVAAPLPDAKLLDKPFHALCGTSTVARLKPDETDAIQRDPFTLLHEHYRFVELATAHGLRVANLHATGAYLVGTQENHSELHGPFANWRREFTRAVHELGRPLTREVLDQFGLDMPLLRTIVEVAA